MLEVRGGGLFTFKHGHHLKLQRDTSLGAYASWEGTLGSIDVFVEIHASVAPGIPERLGSCECDADLHQCEGVPTTLRRILEGLRSPRVDAGASSLDD